MSLSRTDGPARVRIKALALLAITATGLAGAERLHAEVVAVVGARSPIPALTQAQIADLFLGKLTRLPGGAVAVPLDQPEGSPQRDEFYLRITGKSPAQMKAFWSKLIFTGRGRPPRAVGGSTEVLQAVRTNPAAIGYIERRFVDATVRVLP